MASQPWVLGTLGLGGTGAGGGGSLNSVVQEILARVPHQRARKGPRSVSGLGEPDWGDSGQQETGNLERAREEGGREAALCLAPFYLLPLSLSHLTSFCPLISAGLPEGFPRAPPVPPGPLYVPLPGVSLELFTGQLHVSPVGGTIHTGHSPAGM